MFMSISKDKGSALVMVMMFTLVLTILGTAMLGITINEYRMEKTHMDSVKAYYLAEAGMEKAIYDIAEMTSIDPGTLTSTTWEMESGDGDLLDTGETGDFTATVRSVILTETIYADEAGTIVHKYIYEVSLESEGTVEGMVKEIEAKVRVEDYVIDEGMDNKAEVVYWRQIK